MVQQSTDGLQQRILALATVAVEVIGIDRPDHSTAELLRDGKVDLVGHTLLIVVTNPLVGMDSVGNLLDVITLQLPTILDHGANFIVAEHAHLFGDRAGGTSGAGHRRSDAIGRAGQREGATVEWNAQDNLVRVHALADPVVDGIVHHKLLVDAGGAGQGVQWSVVGRLRVPPAVEVVGHQVDKIKNLVQLGNVVSTIDGGRTGTGRSRKHEAMWLEGRLQLLQQSDKVTLVGISAGKTGITAGRLHRRVLPVKVETIQVKLFQERHHRLNKLGTSRWVRGHGRVLVRALVPATDRDHCGEVLVIVAQIVHSANHA